MNLEDLEVYTLSLVLAKEIYTQTMNFPKFETYGISSQLQRAIVSVGANISEGYGRFSVKEKKHFCAIAKGSLKEVVFLLNLSLKLKYTEQADVNQLLRLCKDLDVKIYNFMTSIK